MNALLLVLALIPVPQRETEPKPEPNPVQIPVIQNPVLALLGVLRVQVTEIHHRVYLDPVLHETYPTRSLDLDWYSLELYLRFKTVPQDVAQIQDWCCLVFGAPWTPEGLELYKIQIRAFGQESVLILIPEDTEQRDIMTSRYLSFRNRNNQLRPILTNLDWISPALARYILRDQFSKP